MTSPACGSLGTERSVTRSSIASTAALDDVVSSNALCGTGMLGGRRRRFSAARSARTEARRRPWSDGLTLIDAGRGLRVWATGCGAHSGYTVRRQSRRTSSAARAGLVCRADARQLQLGRSSPEGDFRGAVIADNVIDCACSAHAPRSWWDSPVRQRDIIGNQVAKQVRHQRRWRGRVTAPTAIFANRERRRQASTSRIAATHHRR